MSADEFFSRLAALLPANPPAAEDTAAVALLAKLGLRPGNFDPPPGSEEALSRGLRAARSSLTGRTAPLRDGWTTLPELGRYGTDYRLRAAIARSGLGATLTADTDYRRAEADSDGQPLTGTHRYLLRFPPGGTPPTNALWSVTAYDERRYLVPNALDRYALGSADPLVTAEDGSVELLIQAESPPAGQVPNWLPVPPGRFSLVLRRHWPADLTWAPPPLHRL
jgi:hypothetical protein